MEKIVSISVPTVSLAALKPIGAKNVNPHATEAERIAKNLCEELGIGLPNFDEFNTMSAYLFPETGLQRLVSIILFCNLTFYIDDLYDRHNGDLQEEPQDLHDLYLNAAKIFATGAPHIPRDDPFLRATYELHVQLKTQSPHLWLERMSVGFLDHLKSRFVEPDDAENNGENQLERYKNVRDHDSAMHPTVDLIEFAMGITLTPDILNNPDVQEARLLLARYGSLSNDLFSFEKEVMRYGSDFNLLSVLMREGASFEDAVNVAIEMLNGMVDRFVELGTQTPQFDDDFTDAITAQYFRHLHHQFSAAYHWQFSTPRYRSPQSPFEELREPLWV